MPRVTVYYLARQLPLEGLERLPDAIASVIVDCLGTDSDAVTVSVAPMTPAKWDTVLERANAEGPFVRLPRYPTTAKITRNEEP